MSLKMIIFFLATIALFLFSGCIMDGIEGGTDHVNSTDTTLATITSTSTDEEKAWNHLKKALDLAKIDQDTQGQYAAALIELDKAIALNPTLVKAYHYRGIVHDFNQQPQEAMADIQQALRLDSTHIPSYFAKAGLCATIEDSACLIQTFDKIIELDSTNIKAYKQRGLIKLTLKDRVDGCKDLKKAKELGNEMDTWEIFCDH